MGTILQAACTCGYKSEELYEGFGMFDLDAPTRAPALCRGCKSVVNAAKVAPLTCPECSSNDIALLAPPAPITPAAEESSDQRMERAREDADRKQRSRYPCPRCGTTALKLEEVGMWD